MFLSSFLIFMVVLVVGMIVLWDCGLFLVFHVWVGIVVVGVGIGFFVFGGSGGGVVLFGYVVVMVYVVIVWEFDVFECTSKYFCFAYSRCKDGLCTFCYIT